MYGSRRAKSIAARVLPGFIKEPFRARLFGYRQTGVPFNIRFVSGSDGVTEVLIDEELHMHVPASVIGDIQFHFQQNGEAIEEMHALMRVAREIGGCIFDVGAYHGVFAAIFCLVRAGNTAVCFEPSQPALSEAASLRALNLLDDRVHLEAAAVGDAPGEASAWVNDTGFAIFDEGADSHRSALVKITTLDEMVRRGFPVPSVVKIDVEGAEHAVLMGARELLSHHHPLLMLEFHLDIMERGGQRPRKTVEILLSLGYRFQDLFGKEITARDVYDVPHAIHRVIAV
jgi:FkbM family methyltransferase